jgi:hypothetical protein
MAADKSEETIREIAARHGIAVGLDDPILVLDILAPAMLMTKHQDGAATKGEKRVSTASVLMYFVNNSKCALKKRLPNSIWQRQRLTHAHNSLRMAPSCFLSLPTFFHIFTGLTPS